jgi:hypothetical protein
MDKVKLEIDRPRKIYLVEQVLTVMRAHISRGDWGEYLPPERVLSERMQVGRNTIRQALAQLEKEKVVSEGHAGRRRKILKKTGRAKSPAAPRRVILLTPEDPQRLQIHTLRDADILQRLFTGINMDFDIMTSKAFSVENCDGILDKLTSIETADLWLMKNAPYSVQGYFDKRKDLSALVIGYTYPDIKLPFVTENTVAAARHAVGHLSARGHRSISILQQRSILAGHQKVLDAVKQLCDSKDMQLHTINFESFPDSLCRKVNIALESDNPPTAIITTRILDLIACLTYLENSGLRVPQDVSLISLFDDPLFDSVIPTITRYTVNNEHMMHQIFNLAGNLLGERKDVYQPVNLIPKFVDGNSVLDLSAALG